MKSNGQAEMRRNYEELVNALRQLEEENKRLRARLERAPVQKRVEVVEVRGPLTPGKFVDYLDKRGHLHAALVLEVRDGGALRVKVFHRAVPNVVLEVREFSAENLTNCWRRRA